MLIPFKEEKCKTINGLKIFDIKIDFKDINFTFKKISNKLEHKNLESIFFFIFADGCTKMDLQKTKKCSHNFKKHKVKINRNIISGPKFELNYGNICHTSFKYC